MERDLGKILSGELLKTVEKVLKNEFNINVKRDSGDYKILSEVLEEISKIYAKEVK